MKKKDVLEAPFIIDMIKTTTKMYSKGWDERNGGNVSYLLNESDVEEYLDLNKVIRKIPLEINVSTLLGKIFLVTGSGEYFSNIKYSPEKSLGIVRISEKGDSLELLWGFASGGKPTSELPSHLMSHITRLSVNQNNRVIMHCHASHLLAMTFTHPLIEKEFTKTLWQMCTECLVVFPEGVGIIPWLVPGTIKIGKETSNKMLENRLVLWPHHGVYGAGEDLDETFGLIETAEKAAEVYTYVQAQGGIMQSITDEQLLELSEVFQVTPREGYLDNL